MEQKSPQSAGGIASAIVSRQRSITKYYENPKHCKYCDAVLHVKENQRVADVRAKKFCTQSCAAKFNNAAKGRVKKSPVPKKEPLEKYHTLSRRTKGDIFTAMLWQSARTAIRVHAAHVYEKTEKPKKCNHCGYSNHFEICHKKAVASFPKETTIAEINAPDNLVGLCPNCHWEFDNGLLQLSGC